MMSAQMMSGYDFLNKKRFNSRRKVDRGKCGKIKRDTQNLVVCYREQECTKNNNK